MALFIDRTMKTDLLIKVCGMREPENIRQVIALGIDMIGFIFYPGSPRYVGDFSPVSTPGVSRVGVFVNESEEAMLDAARRYSLDTLQLHGDESPDCCARMRGEGFRVIKAVGVSTCSDLEATNIYGDVVDLLLFDTRCEGYGGSGNTFDWTLLNHYCGKIPFLLSGGLSSESIAGLEHLSNPLLAGVDLNSRFEISPGIKSVELLKSFIDQIRNK